MALWEKKDRPIRTERRLPEGETMTDRMSDEEIIEKYAKLWPNFALIARFYQKEMDRAREAERGLAVFKERLQYCSKKVDELESTHKIFIGKLDTLRLMNSNLNNYNKKLEAENAILKNKIERIVDAIGVELLGELIKRRDS